MKKINLFTLTILFLGTVIACSAQKKLKISFPEEKLGWKLGSQAYTFRLYTFAEALDKIDSCQLRYVEAFPGQTIGAGSTEQMGAGLSPEGRALVKKLLKEKGITLHAFGVVGADNEEGWVKVFEFAKEMGVQVINVEPWEEEQWDIISKLCDKYQIKAALHNHPKDSKFWNPDIVLKALEGRSPLMGATADLGHWMRSGLDPVECLKKLEGKVYHIHFKDLNAMSDKDAHDVHWGTGKLPLKGVIAELKRQKFKGMLAAEYEYNWENNKDDVKASAANLRKILSKK